MWQCGRKRLPLGGRALIMGILNVTPDSFSDGGQFDEEESAVDCARQLLDDGADILDVGGESTRPGAAAVSAGEERRRVVPVIERVLAERPDAVVSVDTSKAEVAEAAVAAGASIINDVSAMSHDPRMATVAAASGAGVVLMHMRGTPRTMQDAPAYEDVLQEVAAYLAERVDAVQGAGVPAACVAIDPGIGFGKTLQHNLALLAGLDVLRGLGKPLLVGLSRKSFLGTITGRPVDRRLAGSLAAMAWCVRGGVDVMRVHDVPESLDVARVLDELTQVKGC